MSSEKFGIGKRLKLYREQKGLKIAQLSEIIDISPGTLSELENEKSYPRADTLQKFIRNTDINLIWLLVGEGAMLREEPHQPVFRGVAEAGAPYLTADEGKIIHLLRENPEFTGLVLKLLGGRKSVTEALEALLKIPDPTPRKP